MFVEIEAKLKVDSLEAVERQLAACGATYVSQKVQVDCYFDTADRQLTQTDRCLRLRTERSGEHERIVLTYKGPKQTDDFKKREEVNLDVADAAAVESLLQGLGYRRALAFDKRRSVWDCDGCEIALDELPLIGVFVEIEGPDSERIGRVRTALGLAEAPHVMESYASLIEKELSRLGSAGKEVFL
ncbi:MAG: class IV adenylate cyclase [Planctomycetota bacterium]|jgi:adenylate cyclase class 2